MTVTEPTNRPNPTDIEAAVRSALGEEYRVDHVLGRGGMSVVFLAQELGLKRLVALKVCPLKLALEESAADRFRQEAQIAASLDHPHVAPIHRFGVASGFLWYTMKYIRGSSLDETLRKLGRLGLHSVLSLTEQTASALDHAHRHGIVHRDVKPGNVMLDDNSWAYVCDFGVAKAGDIKLTQTGGTIGTPAYMSPEQLYGKPLDGRSDQYSLAVMTFELLTGRHPFVADSVAEIINMHCTTAPPRVSEFRSDLPDRVSDGVARAMAKDPEQRFESAIDFLVAIGGRRPPRAPQSRQSLQASEAVTERMDYAPTTTAPSRPARHVTWGLGAVAVALLIWAGAIVTRGAAPVTPPGTVEPAAFARLWVNATPWGDLYIDSVHVGRTPGIDLPVGPGSHVVRIERDGYVPVERRFQLAPGEELRLTDIVLQRVP